MDDIRNAVSTFWLLTLREFLQGFAIMGARANLTVTATIATGTDLSLAVRLYTVADGLRVEFARPASFPLDLWRQFVAFGAFDAADEQTAVLVVPLASIRPPAPPPPPPCECGTCPACNERREAMEAHGKGNTRHEPGHYQRDRLA